jgi:hypothetical protein
MREGWFEDQYLVLFEATETGPASERYSLGNFLPGYELVGMKGWDDFIVRNAQGGTFTVPTIPIDAKHASPYRLSAEPELRADKKFEGRIKWYLKPLVFGGDVSAQNEIWVNHEQHVQLVRYWNDVYRSVSGAGS